jgi:hypothetical protein
MNSKSVHEACLAIARGSLKRRAAREKQFFRRRSAELNEWSARRDGSQGAASPCRCLRVVDGEVVVEVVEAGFVEPR